MENNVEDVKKKKKKKVKKTKTKKCSEDTVSETIKNIKIDEKNMAPNEDLQYVDIESHKNNAEKIIDNICNTNIKLSEQEIKLNEHGKVKIIISETEFNNKIKFIEEHQDVDQIDVEKAVSMYNTLVQYIDECTTYIESTNMVIHHC